MCMESNNKIRQQPFKIDDISIRLSKSMIKTSLLYSSQSSPASSKEFMDALEVSPDGDVKRNTPAPHTLTDHFVSSEQCVEVNSFFEGRREVRFTGIPELSESDTSSEEHHEKDFDVDGVDQQLQHALADLSAERVLRQHKEKCLIKLAKELSKRSTDSSLKERKLIQMAETVNSMHAALQKEREDQYNDHQRYHEALLESDERAVRMEETAEALRAELYKAKFQVTLLRAELASARMNSKYGVRWGVSVLLAVTVLALRQYDVKPPFDIVQGK